ncbi:GNAT family N-acetyltransferase [Halobacteria archaeon AArc-dxtr1]|nr:GNAT family N-acetyltransferase [Halobacteria archaeon AArc-dxtr1]
MTDEIGADEGLSIAPVSAEDEQTRHRLKELAADAFPTPQDAFVHLSEDVLAARVGGTVVGGVILDLVEGSNGPVGMVSWLFTDPSAQGRGVGRRLLEEAVAYLQKRGCQAALAVVQWQNTPSSKLFARQGFERISTPTLVRRFGVRQSGRIVRSSYHFMNVGCDLWCIEFARTVPADDTAHPESTQAERSDSTGQTGGRWHSLSQLGTTVVVHALLLAIVVGGVTGFSWSQTTLLMGGVGGLLIVLRTLPYLVATARDDRRWSFQSWENVFPFSGVIALLGGFLPVPGNVTPEKRDWSYDSELAVLGPAAVAWGVLLVAGLATLAGVRGQFDADSWQSLRTTLLVFVIVDLWLVVWPFDGYNGRIVYDWNRVVWGLLSVAAAIAVGVVYVG